LNNLNTIQHPLPNHFTVGRDQGANVRIFETSALGEQFAEIIRTKKGWTIRDLGESTPVYVDQQAIAGRVALLPGATVQIADWTWIVDPEANLTAPTSGLHIALSNVSHSVPKPFGRSLKLLSGVNVDVQPGEFVGILGPSGSGKSTLLHLMNGDISPTAGTILFNNEMPATFLPIHRKSLGYLPQEPILHELLTPRLALNYSASLRGVPLNEDGTSVVLELLRQVGVAHRADTPIRKISGGERKRVALAAELLGDPCALFLDEATSGLDPALEREMMELFREQADAGKTVICITHFPNNVTICDRLIIVSQGHVLFEGTPPEVLTRFQIEQIGDIYPKLSGDITSFCQPASSKGESPIFEENVTAPARSSCESVAVMTNHDMFVQLATLASRYVRLLTLDTKTLLVLLFQAPIIALLIGATFGNIAVDYSEQHAADWKQVAFLLVMSVIWCAATNGVREIVKERSIFFHERRYGLSPISYLGSKLIPLGTISILQAFLLLFVLGWITRFSGNSIGHLLILSLLALASTALGLFISAGSKTSEQSMTLLPIILIAQGVLSGGLARLTGLTKLLAGLFVSAYWGLTGLKSTLSSNLVEASFISSPGEYQPLILGRGAPLWLDAIALCLQTGALLYLTIVLLRRCLPAD